MRKWTKDKCLEESLKFKTRTDFFYGSSKAYHASRRNGWSEDVCSHMEILGNAYKRLIYAFMFPDKSVYIGLTHDAQDRKTEHLSSSRSSVFKYMILTGLTPKFIELTEYLDVDLSIFLESEYVDFYRMNDWNILNRKKSGDLGSIVTKWNFENCLIESRKYSDRSTFMKKSSGAYSSSIKNGWMDKICSHMEIKIKKNYWTKEKCVIESLKYKNRNQFKKNSCDAYSYAYRNNILDEICSHMKRYPNNFKKIKLND